jgi:putative flippase GtrA
MSGIKSLRKYLPQLFEIMRFLVVGGGGAIVNYFMVQWGLNQFPELFKPIITVSCHALLIVPVYLLQRSFTFRSDANHVQAFPKYFTTQLVALGINFAISTIIFPIFKIDNKIGAILVIGLTSILSMLALKFWAFKK